MRRLQRALKITVVVAGLTAAGACGGGAHQEPSDGGAPEQAEQEPPYLWYAGGTLSAFKKSQTGVSNDDGPYYALVPDLPVHNCHDLAFDAAGNLWTIAVGTDGIMRLPADKLTSFAPTEPDLVITSPALKGPQSLVFDAAGNLWVLSYAGAGPAVASITRFDDPRSLTGAQALTPSLTILPGPGPDEIARFRQGTAIAFDGSGNLWFVGVANALRIDQPASLSGTVAAAPGAVVATGDALGSLAFDAGGSLWITAARDGRYFVYRFANAGSLHGAVATAPAAKIQLALGIGATFAGGMTFDADGALWIVLSSAIVKLPGADTLAGAVSVAPAVVLGSVTYPDLTTKLVLHPTPPGLPLFEP